MKAQTVDEFLNVTPLERRELYARQLSKAWRNVYHASPQMKGLRTKELFELITQIRDDGWCVYWNEHNIPFMP